MMTSVARSHDPNSCQKRVEKSGKVKFWRICEFIFLSLLFILLSGVTTIAMQLPEIMAKGSWIEKKRQHSWLKVKLLTLLGISGQRSVSVFLFWSIFWLLMCRI